MEFRFLETHCLNEWTFLLSTQFKTAVFIQHNTHELVAHPQTVDGLLHSSRWWNKKCDHSLSPGEQRNGTVFNILQEMMLCKDTVVPDYRTILLFSTSSPKKFPKHANINTWEQHFCSLQYKRWTLMTCISRKGIMNWIKISQLMSHLHCRSW